MTVTHLSNMKIIKKKVIFEQRRAITTMMIGLKTQREKYEIKK